MATLAKRTASARRARHGNECARPLVVFSTVLLHANQILSAQNSLLGMALHLRSPQLLPDCRRLAH